MELVVQVPECEQALLPEGEALHVVPDPDGLAATVTVMLNDAPSEVRLEGELAQLAIEDNIRGVGVALIEAFPVSLELAGVVLTMAMFGAVILARRQIELTEDEKREASGLPRIGHHDDPKGGEVTHG